MANPTADENSEVSQNVLNKIYEYLEGEDRLVTVICFLTDGDNKSAKRYIQALKSVLDNDKAFEKIVDKLAEDKDETESPLFEDILNKVMEHLKDSPEKLDTVLEFFMNQETEIINRNTQILKTVFNDDEAFQKMVDKIVEDINDPLCQDINDTHIDVIHHGEDSQIPQNILNQIAECLKNAPDKLVEVLCFFSDHEVEITKWYYQVLDAVKGNYKAFQVILNNLIEDLGKLKTSPDHLRSMADIWNYHLKTILYNIMSSPTLMASAAYNFIGTLSRLPPNVQNEVIQLTMTCAGSVIALPLTINSLNQNLNGLLTVTTSKYGNAISVGLLAVFLTYETWTNVKQWWKGEISGKLCAKNIIDSCAGLAGGVVGGMAGASIGAAVVTGIGLAFGTVVAPGVPAIGSIIGSVAGGIIGSALATKLSEWLTQYFFNLSQYTVLENAYTFLELECGASNEKINSSFARKASEYIPDKGENDENWFKLQYHMSVIKLSKGES